MLAYPDQPALSCGIDSRHRVAGDGELLRRHLDRASLSHLAGVLDANTWESGACGVVGLVEGVAEATQNIVQGFSGWLSGPVAAALKPGLPWRDTLSLSPLSQKPWIGMSCLLDGQCSPHALSTDSAMRGLRITRLAMPSIGRLSAGSRP